MIKVDQFVINRYYIIFFFFCTLYGYSYKGLTLLLFVYGSGVHYAMNID